MTGPPALAASSRPGRDRRRARSLFLRPPDRQILLPAKPISCSATTPAALGSGRLVALSGIAAAPCIDRPVGSNDSPFLRADNFALHGLRRVNHPNPLALVDTDPHVEVDPSMAHGETLRISNSTALVKVPNRGILHNLIPGFEGNIFSVRKSLPQRSQVVRSGVSSQCVLKEGPRRSRVAARGALQSAPHSRKPAHHARHRARHRGSGLVDWRTDRRRAGNAADRPATPPDRRRAFRAIEGGKT